MIVNKAFQAPRSISFSDWNNWIFIKNTIFECSELITNYEDRELKCNQLHRLFYLLQDMMSTWRNRGRPPHSAELTFQILEVIYRDFTACQTPRVRYDTSNRSCCRVRYLVYVVWFYIGIVCRGTAVTILNGCRSCCKWIGRLQPTGCVR